MKNIFGGNLLWDPNLHSLGLEATESLKPLPIMILKANCRKHL